MSDDDSDEEMYSITSSQTIYRRSRSSKPTRPEFGVPPKIVVGRADSDENKEYLPVSKWAVDYNNKNYIRSKCNKNKGLHRKVKGQPLDWRVEYDNSYFTRSKVNAPKGLHRMIPEIKRKYVPDEDDLADATGWEFDYGPEFDQIEQDVTFIPEGRIVARGCYRWYGVKRNDSDCDTTEKEHRENLLNEELEEEMKYGHEFLQSDIPHMSEQLKKQYSRGGYRFYEVARNAYDIRPEELASAQHDPEWRRKHHSNGYRYLDLDMCEYDHAEDKDRYVTKGKPFKRTILNKVFELRKRSDSPDSKRYGTRVSLVPGEGEKTVYHGVPDRYPFKQRKTPSLRHVFKRKSDIKKYHGRREGSDYEHEMEEVESRTEEISPEYAERRRSRGSRREDDLRGGRKSSVREYAYKMRPMEDDDSKSYHMKASRRSSSSDDVRDTFETWREDSKHLRRKSRKDMGSKEPERRTSRPRRDYDYTPESKLVDKRNYRQEYDSDEHPTESSRGSRKISTFYNDKHWEETKDSTQLRRKSRKDMQSKEQERRPSKPRRDYDYTPESKLVDKRKYRQTYDSDERPTESSQSSRKISKYHDNDEHWEETKKERMSSSSRSTNKSGVFHLSGEHQQKPLDKGESTKKLPPHVQERMRKIREKMEKKMGKLEDQMERDKRIKKISSGESIDLMKHKTHPDDHGHTHSSEYEKYITQNGSEIWMRKEEKIAELHHKDTR